MQITPKRVTTTKTKTVGTITKTKFKVEPTVITKTKTKTCSVPRRQPTRDPWCTITPTLVHAAALETSSTPIATSSSKSGSHRRQDAVHKLPLDIEQRLAERRARLAEAPVLEKRGLDNATATLTETDTSKFSTSTVSVTTTTSTLVLSTVLTTKTTVVSTSTTYKGVTRPVVTKTAVSRSYIRLSKYTADVPSIAHPNQDEDEVYCHSYHGYDHEAPKDHGHDQMGAGVEHGDL